MEFKKAKNKDEHFGPEDVFSPMSTSEGLKMYVSMMMTAHGTDGSMEMATWDVSRAHCTATSAGGSTHIFLKGRKELKGTNKRV